MKVAMRTFLSPLRAAALRRLLFLLLGAALPAAAAESAGDRAHRVGFDPRVEAALPSDVVLRDEDNHPVHLGDFFAGEPVILLLGYYRCPNLCSTVMMTALETLGRTDLEAGRQFQLVAVSIDPRETPAMAAAAKAAWLRAYGGTGAAGGFHFLTGGGPDLARLARAIGFRYVYDREHGQFAHPAGLIVATPAAHISRYFPGLDYRPRDLRLSLLEASSGRTGTLTDHLLLLCYGYDAASGRYGVAIWSILRAGCIATVVALVLFVLWLRRSRGRETPVDR